MKVKKQSKIKKELDTLKKEKGISKKLSKHEENQYLLSTMQQKQENIEVIPQEQKQSRRIFTCSCGCQVTLEGEIYKRKVKDGFELCSKCSKE